MINIVFNTVKIQYICKPYYEKNINDINLTINECLLGWMGDNCEEKEYIDYM